MKIPDPEDAALFSGGKSSDFANDLAGNGTNF